MREFKFLSFIIILTLLIGSFSVVGINQESIVFKDIKSNDYYFVHLTDTHIRHKIVDFSESTTNKLKTVLNKVISYQNKPAFIVITGDLCEWAGSDPIGALNCKAFLSCFYEENDQIYADSEHTIPVYTTPGNHDYVISRNLKNYHKYIDKKHVEQNDRYNITYEDLTLYFMDSGPNYYSDIKILFEWHGEGLCSDDIEWLEEELDNCKTSNKIVLMHHPAVGKEHDLFIKNREEFFDLCENYQVDVVLAGHTHSYKVYYYNNRYYERPLNCSNFTTLYVQSDDCREAIHYRNISIIGNDIWIESNVEIEETISDIKDLDVYNNIYFDMSKKVLLNKYKR